MFDFKKTALEVLLLAASAAGAPAIACMHPDQISKNLALPNTMFVGRGTPANIVADFAEQIASKPNVISR